MYKKTLALSLIVGAALLIPSGSTDAYTGTNIISANSCTTINSTTIKVNRFGADQFLVNGVRDAGHGPRAYIFSCVGFGSGAYKVSFQDVVNQQAALFSLQESFFHPFGYYNSATTTATSSAIGSFVFQSIAGTNSVSTLTSIRVSVTGTPIGVNMGDNNLVVQAVSENGTVLGTGTISQFEGNQSNQVTITFTNPLVIPQNSSTRIRLIANTRDTDFSFGSWGSCMDAGCTNGKYIETSLHGYTWRDSSGVTYDSSNHQFKSIKGDRFYAHQ